MKIKSVMSAGSFRTLLGRRPYCSDPAWEGHVLPPLVQTVTLGVIRTEGGVNQHELVLATSPPQGLTGSFDVADNDFTTGWVELILGDFRLINGFEYTPAALDTDTAIALTAAISALEGFSATVLGTVVTVTHSNTMGEVEFRAVHRGTKTNFDTFVPNTGYLGTGDPTYGPLIFT